MMYCLSEMHCLFTKESGILLIGLFIQGGYNMPSVLVHLEIFHLCSYRTKHFIYSQ
jgi:hypothetical protein